jgi:hypothetical protein
MPEKQPGPSESEFLSQIIEALPFPFYIINVKDRSIALANAAAHIASIQGTTCHALMHRSDTPCADGNECPMEIIRRTGKPAVVEHVHFDEEKGERIVEVRAFPIFDDDGELVQMIELAVDITERRRLERERERTIQELHDALAQVRTLSGLLPICASCRRIRDKNEAWVPLEQYVQQHTEADFTHSICPTCRNRLYGG